MQSEGTCRLSSFSSAFYEYFNEYIATGWMKNTIDYKKAMSQPVSKRSQKSGVMNYLKSLVIKTKGNAFRVETIKKEVPWAELNKTTHYKLIVISLLRGSDDSRDHIVSISHGWIFDSNLDFALPLNKESLDWCCGFMQNGTTFDGFWEMASVSQCFIGK
jgi:hypothetical protein